MTKRLRARKTVHHRAVPWPLEPPNALDDTTKWGFQNTYVLNHTS